MATSVSSGNTIGVVNLGEESEFGEATVGLRPTVAAERRRQRRGDGSTMATSVSSDSEFGVVNLGEETEFGEKESEM
ncbi:hypothetical protein DEO72_LG7g1180 [Vigna unguiculata]|uniref:Uncharacterized protein n=1 Tax=Vigna unguiculata TaxID=3917 RepID=A0A4D6MEM5_VIGUN|nr:hypothetical protein DEO72_LG7g1179 [Vigna unguiculata]QCD99893.1 hypothetical protein DEO72_LG7g1180 [Vigna unguiculata]